MDFSAPVPHESIRTLEDVRAEFDRKGLSYKAWAQQHGFAAEEVYAILNGRSRGRRGRAHNLAVALGLKVGEPVAL